MNGTNNNCLYAFEENEKLSAEIRKIISENDSDNIKIHKLKSLKADINTPLAQSHIDYYIKKLYKTMRDRFSCLMCAVVAMSYLLFTLCRVFWYYHPEENPLPETNNTISDLIVILYLMPVIIIAIFIIKKVIQKINKTYHST